MRAIKVLLAVGGTGGHLLPAQQLAALLSLKAEVMFAGHLLGESPFFTRRDFLFRSIPSAPLSRTVPGFFRFGKEMFQGVRAAVRLMREFAPDAVVGFGSFHTVPVLLAAVLLRRRIALFEPNAVLGKANRLFRPFASLLGAQFPQFPGVAAVPLLPWASCAAPPDRAAARESLGLSPDRATILVAGGSQGASFLNRQLPACLSPAVQVIHLAGHRDAAEVGQRYRDLGIRAYVSPFEQDMAPVYSASDAAVCRAGAGTVADLIRYRVPAILIPFPFAAGDHQRKNGLFLANTVKGGILVLEREAGREAVVRALSELFENRDRFSEALAAFAAAAEERVCFSERIFQLCKT